MAVKRKPSRRDARGRFASKPTAHDAEQAKAQSGNTKRSRWDAAKKRRAEVKVRNVKERKTLQAKLNKRVGTKPNTRKAKAAQQRKAKVISKGRIPRPDLQQTTKTVRDGKKVRLQTYRFEGTEGFELMEDMLRILREQPGVSTRMVAGTDFGRNTDWVGTNWNNPALTVFDIQRLTERYKFLTKAMTDEDEESEDEGEFHWYELTVRRLVDAGKASAKRVA